MSHRCSFPLFGFPDIPYSYSFAIRPLGLLREVSVSEFTDQIMQVLFCFCFVCSKHSCPGLSKYMVNSNSENYLPRQRTSASQKFYLGICIYLSNLYCLEMKGVGGGCEGS